MNLQWLGRHCKLDIKTHTMPYTIYKQQHVNKVYVPILEAINHMIDTDRDTFIDSITKLKCKGEGHRFNYFNIIKSSSEYCKLDCSVLHNGYDIFPRLDINIYSLRY